MCLTMVNFPVRGRGGSSSKATTKTRTRTIGQIPPTYPSNRHCRSATVPINVGGANF